MDNNILEVSNLSKRFKHDGFLLEDINFIVPQGSIVGLIGENGSGKTTTINLILGLRKKDSGQVKIFGNEYNTDDIAAKKRIGVAFDDIVLPKNLTAKGVSKIYKNFYTNWNEDKFILTLDKFGIDKNKKISDYSKGMQKIFTIILSMTHQPEFLILDEPTSSLDPVKRQETLGIFQDFIEDGTNSILFSSHITTDIEHISDFVVFINKGKLIFFEPITKLLYEYALVKCTSKVFDKIERNNIIAFQKESHEHIVLMKTRNGLELFGDDIVVENPTLEGIMNIYAKGVVLWFH